ncbi:HEAT repeat domain-containing protein [Lacihabitans sp. CS3-21]|uniref:HEAT repeat domain-containing protein n=1 Tax=Lacihabitans sp. CS3-21 TaxID=2487332 RepID=UPI0020CE7C4E|nr:HEAT repeat domain-containing protein [Lacihabitans sp. CS3-21]MCP9749125.1 HEAT repeat domain-containing protein [Lacihabitans sp. CS3-21]
MDEQFDDIEKTLWEQMGKLRVPEPSKDVKIRFHAMLDTFKAEEEAKKEGIFQILLERFKTLFAYKPAYNWAYAMILIVISSGAGYFIGKPNSEVAANSNEVKRLSSEVQDMKQMMMLSMLENPVATERLKAVSYTQELNNVDDQVIDALLTTLNFDQNENVRLVTLEALIQLAENPKVREGLVQSLLTQESPLMQVALADAMVKLQEKRSVKQFKELLRKENLNDAVKGKIEKTILVLS